MSLDGINPWHIPNAGSGDGGSTNSVAQFRKNPGTKVTLKRIPSLTKKGLLEQAFDLPAPPLDSFTRTLNYNWSDYDTVSDGQYSRPGGMQLQTITFDTIVVADDYPWTFYNPLRTRGWDAAEVVRQLGAILRSGTPIQFIVQQVQFKPNPSGEVSGIKFDFGATPLVNIKATLRSLSSSDRAGEPDAKYVNLSFVEFREPGASQRKLGKSTSGGGSGVMGREGGRLPVNVKGGPTSSKVPAALPIQGLSAPGNTLHGLATVYYGSAAKWTVIKNANTWLGNVTPDQDLTNWTSTELKTAGKANRRLTLPVLSG